MFWTIDASLETVLPHLPPEAQPPVRRLGDDSGGTIVSVYRSNASACCGSALACANTAIPDCTST